MPLADYDKWFGSKKGSAARAHQEMVKTYGMAKGTRIFYALLRDRQKAKKTYGRRKR